MAHQHNTIRLWYSATNVCRRWKIQTEDKSKRHYQNWIGLDWAVFYVPAKTVCYMGDGFYRSKDPTNSIEVLKEQVVHRQIKHTISRHEHKTQQVP